MSYRGTPNFWISNVFVRSFDRATGRDTPGLSTEQKLEQWNTVFAPLKAKYDLTYEELASAIVFAFVFNPLKFKKVDDYGALDARVYGAVVRCYLTWVDEERPEYMKCREKGDRYLDEVIKKFNKTAKRDRTLSKRNRNAHRRASRFSEFSMGFDNGAVEAD